MQFIRSSAVLCGLLSLLTISAVYANDRITAPVDVNRRVGLKGHMRPEVQPQNDQGLAAADTPIDYATLLFKLDPSIETFLAEQQNPGSPSFRRWLTPDQFGDRFGLSPGDMAKVIAWLESQGLKINDVAKGRNWITFSGTAARVSRALRTDIHVYDVKGERHFANSSEPSIPEALQGVVGGFRGLNDFPEQSMLRRSPVDPPQSASAPAFNSGATNHFLAPDDLATIFNIKALYAAGIDGTGQSLVIAGQTALNMNDFKLFQSRFGLPANLPVVTLFGADPGIRTGDLVEADLDLQWSTAVARNATINYVYATNVFTAAQYAIDQNMGQQMSISYGGCEPYQNVSYRAVAQQANAQGMTIFISSGDSAAATCDRNSPIDEATHGATASWPASFPEITSVGGTEFDDSQGTFWATSNDANGASALSYIPEVPWNDSIASRSLEGGGGAPSVLITKPVWQTGPGVPNDGARDLPDVSMPASPFKYSYLVYNLGGLIGVGGTSGSSPAWAGLNALLNQYLVSKGTLKTPGLGNINPALYRLAQSTTGVFHDIATGDNKVPCAQSTPDCNDGQVGFFAGPGYDLATGLGSVDAFNYVTNFTSGTASTTTLTPSATSAIATDTVTLTAIVKGGGASPTGTIDFITNDTSLGTVTLNPAGSGTSKATLSIPASQILIGTGTIEALYSGDGVYTGSAGSATIAVSTPSTKGSYVLVFVNPNPVYEAGAGSWPYSLTLTEKNGVSTTINSFTVNGVDNLLNLPSKTLPGNGSLHVSLAGNNVAAPLNRVFAFTGTDGDGTTWSQSISVPFLLPPNGTTPLGPALGLSTTTTLVLQNTSADPSCQWAQQLTVAETGGYLMVLAKLTVNGVDITPQIPVIFGTNRVAPYGVLQGSLCFPAGTATGLKTYLVTASIIDGGVGGSISSIASATLSAVGAPISPLAAIPASVSLTVTDNIPSASSSVGLVNGAGSWVASVIPNNRATKWLTVPANGTGPVSIQATRGGLSSGVYNATVAVNSGTGTVNVPVTLVVNPSTISKVTGVVNNFSGGTTAAPGEMVAVFGTRMAPDIGPIVASTLPLPFSLHGVSATVNGVSAPMYYVSPTQLDLQIPYETGAGPAVLALNNNGQIAAFPITVAATAPGLFATPFDALTGTLASTVKQNQILTLYSTGEGDVTPTLTTGGTPARQTDPTRYPAPRQPVTMTVGGVPGSVLFSGIPNGIAAEIQINVQIPANAPLGKQNLIVSVGGVPSNPISVTVTAAQ